MATYDFGGGCPCGLYKTCCCDDSKLINPEVSTSVKFVCTDEALDLARAVAESNGYVLVKKEDFEALYSQIKDYVGIVNSQLEDISALMSVIRKMVSKQ